jgi:hypothetical protein
MADNLRDVTIIARGGLYTNEDPLTLAGTEPGSAIRMTNFEISQFGGVYRTLGNEIAFSPIPDKAYTINYDYYQYQTTLTNATDTMSVPDQFKNVVIDGAMYHCYMFRDNSQQATIAQQRFTRGIENMRKILVNNFTDLRDTRVNRLFNVPAGSK